MKTTFEKIYQDNGWKSRESLSGPGSTLEQTEQVREFLPLILEALKIETMLDIPCGDMNWMSQTELPKGMKYIGADIVPELIAENKKRFPRTDFRVLDMTNDKLPKVDLILARDVLGHFSNADVKLALVNLRRSGSRYLLATTFPMEETEGDIKTGQWRPINLASWYGLPNQIDFWPEMDFKFPDGCVTTKGLGLWDLRR